MGTLTDTELWVCSRPGFVTLTGDNRGFPRFLLVARAALIGHIGPKSRAVTHGRRWGGKREFGGTTTED